MTISNLIERGNPEDMDEDFAPKAESEGPIQVRTAKTASKSAKSLLSRNTVILAILILTSTASFGLGMLAGGQGSASTGNGLIVGSVPLSPPTAADLSASALGSVGTTSGAIPAGGEVVASKTTHSYYLPWCSQASAISNADKVWFANEQMAKSAGYVAGKGCAGL